MAKAIIYECLPGVPNCPSGSISTNDEAYEYVGLDKSGLHVFKQGDKHELFAKRTTPPAGWHLKRGSYFYEFCRSREHPSMTAKLNAIQRHSFKTRGGNTLEFFYNPENNLLVVDLISFSENGGGNELVRRTLDESYLLRHLAVKKVRRGS